MTRTPRALLAGASLAFWAAVGLRGVGYGSGALPVRRIPKLRILSVGNLRVGGSGKTPLAMFLAETLARAGVRTALVLRGYKGALERRGGVVSHGAGALAGSAQAGDEALLAAMRLSGVAVLAGRDRRALAALAACEGYRVAILDDGFQHRSLHRDLDILLACPEDLDPRTALLPLGPLREPPSAASRADVVGGLAGDWAQDDPGFLFSLAPECLVDPGWKTHPLDAAYCARAFLVSGIARPSRFARTAREAGLEVAGHAVFRDHHRFTSRDAQHVRREAVEAGASLLLTTEKDLARGFPRTDGLPLLALRVSVRLVRGADRLARLITHAVGTDLPLSLFGA
jgi:tetraacyldisaccharide 4'-kinase